MAPKAKPRASVGGAAAKRKSIGGREVIPDRKMLTKKDAKAEEQREKTEKLLKLRAARKIQRYARGMRARSAMRAILLLENVVFVVPTPGEAAVSVILEGPKEVEEDEEEQDGSRRGSKTTSIPVVEPDGSQRGRGSRPGSAGGESRAAMSEYPETLNTSARSSSSGSGSRSRESSWSSTDSEKILCLTEWTLAHQFGKWEFQDRKHAASLIFWMLGRKGEELEPADLERVHRHHRMRRRNANSKVFLYLVLMQHGDAVQSISSRPPTAGPLPNAGPRMLDAKGWEQVTRVSWALRLCHAWSPPGLILSASTQCCLESAERFRLVMEDPENQDLQDLEMQEQPMPEKRECPPVTICEPLDFPRADRAEPLLGPTTYYVSEELANHIRATEPKKRNLKKKPKEPTPSMIVAGGTVVETLLGVLTSARPRGEMIKARLRGGDVVLLKSPPMCSISGEGLEEKWRPSSQLWEDALLKRSDWTVVRHLRGDGTNQPLELGGIPKKKPEIPAEFRTNLTAQWNSYAGAALILTDAQYMEIRRRAGLDQASGMGMPEQLCIALKPLVRDYVPRDENEDPDEYQQEVRQGSNRRVNSKAGGSRMGRRRSSVSTPVKPQKTR